MFWLNGQTRALRSAVIQGHAQDWERTIAFHVGGVAVPVIKTGLRFVDLPEEARLGVSAFEAAEVSIHKGFRSPDPSDLGEILERADFALARRGWNRVVGVVQEKCMVAIYVPNKLRKGGPISVSVLVLNDRDLVVGSIKGNPRPIVELIQKKLPATQGTTLAALLR